MESVLCNLCGSDRHETHLVRSDLNLFYKGDFRLVRCVACGHVYLNPRPTAEELPVYYPENYDQYVEAISQQPSLLFRWDRQYGLRKRCRAVLRHRQNGRLLDVGCATGNFLDAMRQNSGWEVQGIELSRFASEYARAKLGLSVHTGTVEDAVLPTEYFDVITLWDVLEHLPDPTRALRILWRWLKPEGLLLLNTPNLDSLDARVFGRYWIGYELPRHHHVFSERSLGLLLAKTGFRIVSAGCWYGSHAAFASSIRFWLRDRSLNARWRPLAEKMLFLLPVRLIALPYFYAMDRLRLSSPLAVVAMKVDRV